MTIACLRNPAAALLSAGLLLASFACAETPAKPHAAPAKSAAQGSDPLPSWNEGKTKQSILDFVARVTAIGGKDFVAREDRIATFDNDGTLWAEQPLYVQMFFALDRVKELAPKHPEWKDKEPFASLLKGDVKAALSQGDKAILEIVMATHSGMTTGDFDKIVKDWFTKAKNPEKKVLFTDLTYQPMIELLDYLRSNGFKTFIVSGGGVEFMRPFTEKSYGVPTEQVIGSSGKLKFEGKDGKFQIVKLPELNFIDDKAGKPEAIQALIGKRPIAAFGNSDGDLQMLQWTGAGDGARFCMFVHHTDAVREWAYDRKSDVGRLDLGLDAAAANGWTVMDMKTDWKVVFTGYPAK